MLDKGDALSPQWQGESPWAHLARTSALAAGRANYRRERGPRLSLRLFSLFAPKGTPSGIVYELNAGFNVALVSPALLARFSEQSIKSIGGPPNLAGRLLNEDVKPWGTDLA
jgi:hypothetical protein